VISLCVRLSVGMCVVHDTCILLAKGVGRNDMLFGTDTGVVSSNIVLNSGAGPGIFRPHNAFSMAMSVHHYNESCGPMMAVNGLHDAPLGLLYTQS